MSYCKHCGEEIASEVQFCKSCGKAKTTDNESKLGLKERFSLLPKKKKVFLSLVSGSLLLLIVIFFTLNHLWSPEQLIKSLKTAVEDQDYEKIGELVQFEDSNQSIGVKNAEAFVNTVDQEDTLDGVLRHLTQQAKDRSYAESGILNVTESGCFVFIECYQITAKAFYITANSNLNNTVIESDTETVTIENVDDEVELGPFVYGEHDLKASYENQFVQLETDKKIYLSSAQQMVEFYFEYESIFTENLLASYDMTLLLNGEEIDDSMYINDESIGPIDPEKDYTIEIVANLPWGSLTTGELEMSENNYVDADFQPTEELLEEVSKSIRSFYDVLFEAYRSNNPESLSFLNSELQDDYYSSIKSVYTDVKEYDLLHFRDVKEFGLAENAVRVSYNDQLEEALLTVYVMENTAVESQWYTDKIEDPYYEKSYHTFALRYDDGEWSVYNIDFDNWESGYDYNQYDYDGDSVIIGKEQDKVVDNSQIGDDVDEELSEITLSYINKLVDAINSGNYDIVEPYIQENSALEEMQQGLVDRLYDNGTTQEVMDSEVTKIEVSDDSWKINTNETIKIMYGSGEEETQDYAWTYTVVEDDGNFLLSNIE
ncbi:TcaA NTF2-like domain-containing protein [Gracilibacillus saliphilus]|uniref:TcaA NTF2-like domain-containing protein n=1 Tax=Gracilibacillus saliphilus TaxID=543890 RepID=UPI0013D2D7C2|nr:hypothetical protein [Gracilibacillus saliphilus]